MNTKLVVLVCTSFVLAFAVLGTLLKTGVLEFRNFDRVVTVKGLAEKEVEADLAIWPISFACSSNTLSELYGKIEADTNKIKTFLSANQIPASEIIESPVSVTDRFNADYVDTDKVKFRYTISKTLTIRSKEIHKILLVKQSVGELVKSGIVLKMDDYANETRFLYTKLNDIKPEMIKLATESARESAEQFANDSKSSLGKIKNANQGLFTIEILDPSMPYIHKVRVVTSVTYFLKD